MTRLLKALSVSLVAAGSLCGVLHAADDNRAPLVIDALEIGARPSELLVHDGKLYVGSFHGAHITVFDLKTRRQLRRIRLDAYINRNPIVVNGKPVGFRSEVRICPPGDMVVASGRIFVNQMCGDSVAVLEVPSLKIVKRLPIGVGSTIASGDGKTVYHADGLRNCFHIVDAETLACETIGFPEGGRGVGALSLSPDGKRLYVGIQRGGTAPDGKKRRSSGNAFLAVYDLVRKRYVGTVYLAQLTEGGGSDDSIPKQILATADGRLLYIGMFQSLAGIRVVDTQALRIVRDIVFKKNARNRHFEWVDAFSLALYDDWLLSVNRNNRELAVIDRSNDKLIATLDLGPSDFGPRGLLVADHLAYICHHGRECVYILDVRVLKQRITESLRRGSGDGHIRLSLSPR